jgi:hypothetical protein
VPVSAQRDGHRLSEQRSVRRSVRREAPRQGAHGPDDEVVDGPVDAEGLQCGIDHFAHRGIRADRAGERDAMAVAGFTTDLMAMT